MASDTVTETYDTVGQYQIDIPGAAENIWVDLVGAGGGTGEHGSLSPGSGGRWTGTLDLADETIDVWVGGGGSGGGNNAGGTGRSDGGDGGASTNGEGGGGGGSTEIVIAGNMVAAADAGGGAGSTQPDDFPAGGGGGGARGGAGGTGDSPTDGEGSGFGGDGNSSGRTATGGEDGGQEVVSSYLISEETAQTGGGAGATANGSVTVEYDVVVTAVDSTSVTATRNTEIDLSWNVNTPNADGQRIYRDTAPGIDPSTATPIDEVGPETGSYTDTGIDNGETYYYVIETYEDDTNGTLTATSAEVSGQTTLPEVEGFTLDASVQDELTVELLPVLNAGQYRIRWKRSSDSSYPSGNETTAAASSDIVTHIISPVLDGEEYDVQARTETDEVTGAWHTASEITKLVAASGVTFEGVTETTIDSISWTVNSDFDGSQQVWLDRDDYDYGDPKGELLGTVSTTTTSFSDLPDAHPDRTYTVTIIAQTQYVHADSSATTTTPSAGLEQSPIPPRGWYVEVDHPQRDDAETQILDDPQHRPRLNGPSEVEIPVPHSDTWLNDALDDQAMRVYHDGNRLPIDRLADREDESDRVLLHGKGPSALERTVRADVDVEPAHELAQRLIEENTDLVANVDSPTLAEEDTVMQAADASDEWALNTESIDITGLPFDIADGRLHLQQTCFTRHALDRDSDVGLQAGTGFDEAVRGDIAVINGSSQSVTFENTVGHRIPEANVGVSVRVVGLDDSFPVRFLLNGQEIESLPDGFSAGSNTWLELAEGAYVGPGWSGGDIAAGETVTFEIEGYTPEDEDGNPVPGDGNFYFDMVTGIHDTRYSYNFDTTLDEPEGHLDGPELYPVASLEMDAAESVLSVTGGDLVTDFDDTSGAQSIGIRNALGDSYTTAANSETVNTDFDSDGAFIQAELTLSRYGQRSDTTPKQGFQGQSVGSLDLSATLEDTPLIIGQTLEGDLGEQLAEIAEQTNSIYEPAVNSAGDMTIEWTEPGQRTTAEQPDLVDYSIRRVTDKVHRAVISGAALEIREESFTANVGTAVDLDNGEIVPDSDRVYDDSGTVYTRGDDYEIGRQDGTITALSAGDLSDGTEYTIDYEYKVRGEFESGQYNGDTRFELRETIPQLTTTRACALAAKVLVDEQSEARWEADVTFPPSIPADLSLVEAIDLEEMPGDAMAIYELTESPAGLEARLGDQNRVRNRLAQLQRQADAISQRV